VSGEELVGKIEELASAPPRSREELVARLQALARLDLRDVGPGYGQGSPVAQTPEQRDT
jgi:hypothetical protein